MAKPKTKYKVDNFEILSQRTALEELELGYNRLGKTELAKD